MSIHILNIPTDILKVIIDKSDNPKGMVACKALHKIYEKTIPEFVREKIDTNHPLKMKEFTTCSLGKELKQEGSKLPYPPEKRNYDSISDRLLDKYWTNQRRKNLVDNERKIIQHYLATSKIAKEHPILIDSQPLQKAQKNFDIFFSEIKDSIHLKKLQLTNIPRGFFLAKKIRDLNFDDNKISSIQKEIKNLKNLIFFSVRNNQISSIPEELSSLKKLEILDVSKNNITCFPTKLCTISNLAELYLEENLLKIIPSEIKYLSKLEQLILNNNQLESIPDEIGDLTKIEELELKGNKLTYIPATIGKLQKLLLLCLQYNNLTTLPPELSKLHAKVEIVIEDNPIIYLPSQLGHLAKDEFADTIFNLDKDIHAVQNTPHDKLPKRLSLQISQMNQSAKVEGNNAKKVKIDPKDTFLSAMLELKKTQAALVRAKNIEVFSSIINTSTDILHKQQVIEVALECLKQFSHEDLANLIAMIAKTNHMNKFEAAELLRFHPTDKKIKEALQK